jgi:hypothetical protein
MWDVSPFRVTLERKWEVRSRELCCRWYSVCGPRPGFSTRTALAGEHRSESQLQPVLSETFRLEVGVPMVGDGRRRRLK